MACIHALLYTHAQILVLLPIVYFARHCLCRYSEVSASDVEVSCVYVAYQAVRWRRTQQRCLQVRRHQIFLIHFISAMHYCA